MGPLIRGLQGLAGGIASRLQGKPMVLNGRTGISSEFRNGIRKTKKATSLPKSMCFRVSFNLQETSMYCICN